jgi:acetyl esterase/lipase
MAYRLDLELAEIARLAAPLDLRDVAAARSNMVEIMRQMTAAGGAPRDERVEVQDRKIPGPAGAPEVPVRIYLPKQRSGVRPVLVYFHGGAFCLGDLDSEHARCLRICGELGFSVVSTDYRLAPEHKFPAGVEDCYAALVWAARNPGELGGDAARIAIGGASAGGGLAAAVALMARDRGGPALAFQLLIYPVLDDRMQTTSMRDFVDSPIWNRPNSEVMWSLYLGGRPAQVSPYAAPARATRLDGLAPAYLMTAEFDPLRDEGIEYAMRLLQAGVPTELHNYAGAFHGFDQMGMAAISQEALREQLAALRRALGSS